MSRWSTATCRPVWRARRCLAPTRWPRPAKVTRPRWSRRARPRTRPSRAPTTTRTIRPPLATWWGRAPPAWRARSTANAPATTAPATRPLSVGFAARRPPPARPAPAPSAATAKSAWTPRCSARPTARRPRSCSADLPCGDALSCAAPRPPSRRCQTAEASGAACGRHPAGLRRIPRLLLRRSDRRQDLRPDQLRGRRNALRRSNVHLRPMHQGELLHQHRPRDRHAGRHLQGERRRRRRLRSGARPRLHLPRALRIGRRRRQHLRRPDRRQLWLGNPNVRPQRSSPSR